MNDFLYWKYGICGVLFLTLAVLFYHLHGYIKEINLWERYGNWLEKKKNIRLRNEDNIRLTVGAQERRGLLIRLDRMISYSNLKSIFPSLSLESYLMTTIAVAMMMGVLSVVATGFWIMGIMSIIVFLFVSYFFLSMATLVNYRKLEGNIVTFVNLLENYSKTSDDIIKIFGQTHSFLEEPLKTYIREFYYEAVNDGDATRAFHNLENRIEHEKLKEIIHSIEVCSNHEANYEDVIKDNRFSLNDYMNSKEERKAIVNNARIEILLLLGASGICLSIFGGLVQDMKGVMLDTFGGNAILAFCGGLMAYCTWFMIMMERR